MDSRNLAVIPARSGSKGLPDKNILPLLGKPLLAYSVEAALRSGIFDTVHVSTDSGAYAEIARRCGADVPFLRGAEAASDTASSWDAVREVLRGYERLERRFDTVTLLQPTSPLRRAEDIEAAYRLFAEKDADTVISVTETEHPVQWCFTLPKNGSMSRFARSKYHALRRQELKTHYRENGAVYIVRAEKLREPDWDIYSGRCFACVMPQSRSLDIDGVEDFQLAELRMRLSE